VWEQEQEVWLHRGLEQFGCLRALVFEVRRHRQTLPPPRRPPGQRLIWKCVSFESPYQVQQKNDWMCFRPVALVPLICLLSLATHGKS
jgi:hypothetical protein